MSDKFTTQDFIDKSNQVHNFKYDYSLVDYINNTIKVTIICPTHGKFEQVASSHLRGYDCKSCGNIKKNIKNSSTHDQFIEKAIKIHGNKYDYSKTKYTDSRIKVIIICKIHDEFLQKPNTHLNGYGCSKCNSSRGEDKIRNWLTSNNFKFEEQKIFSSYHRFDFYLPKFNLCIEYDGMQHFKPTSFGSDQSMETKLKNLQVIQQRDKVKNEYCLNNNISLLRIPYTKLKNIEPILYKELKSPCQHQSIKKCTNNT